MVRGSENYIRIAHQALDQFQIPDITLNEPDLILNSLEVEKVAAIKWQHGVQDRNPGAMFYCQVGDGAADHARSPGNQDTGAVD